MATRMHRSRCYLPGHVQEPAWVNERASAGHTGLRPDRDSVVWQKHFTEAKGSGAPGPLQYSLLPKGQEAAMKAPTSWVP